MLASEVPLVADAFELDEDGLAALDARIENMRNWAAAMFEWQRSSGRYKPDHVRRRYSPDTLLEVEEPATFAEFLTDLSRPLRSGVGGNASLTRESVR